MNVGRYFDILSSIEAKGCILALLILIRYAESDKREVKNSTFMNQYSQRKPVRLIYFWEPTYEASTNPLSLFPKAIFLDPK